MASSFGVRELPPKPLSRTYTIGTFSTPADFRDTMVVPQSLAVIAPILSVANEIEQENPQVAYLCRFYAFERAHELDPSSTGRGVRQFKTSLLKELEKDEKEKSSDAHKNIRELERFYTKYYRKFVEDGAKSQSDRTTLAKTYRTVSVLFEVLKSLTKDQGVNPEIIATLNDVDKKTVIFTPYNILPLAEGGEEEAIMQLDEVKASIRVLSNTRGLPQSRSREGDIFDWLKDMFGFQKDSVSNQREHLVLLLANFQTRLSSRLVPPNKEVVTGDIDKAIDDVMEKLFENYKQWCNFLGKENNLRLPDIYMEKQQRKIVYMGLYLLIWGEAANLRFMPECLCYIFHHMAGEADGMISGLISSITGEQIKPSYGGAEESFLQKVVKPIYDVIRKEAERGRKGTSPHSAWRNYDDLNEYFWSVHCFNLGWPMSSDDRFFKCPEDGTKKSKAMVKNITELTGLLRKHETIQISSFWSSFTRWIFCVRNLKASRKQHIHQGAPLNKIKFVELRSFWHLFRSFHRMWTFFILSFQAMVIIAWSGSGSLSGAFQQDAFHKVLSIFITAAALKFLQGFLDIVFMLKAIHSIKYLEMLRLFSKALVAAAWVAILLLSYVLSWQTTSLRIGGRPKAFVFAVLAYIAPNVLGVTFFMLPSVRRWTETSNWRIMRVVLWWSQPRLYVGRGMHESLRDLSLYTLFWIILLILKICFSYYVEIKPLVEPTKRIMQMKGITYEWHELFPRAKDNFGAVVALWAPVMLVYFMDTQIWYSIVSTIAGGLVGASKRLGEIRTLGMLRSRFDKLPQSMYDKLVPSSRRYMQDFLDSEGKSFQETIAMIGVRQEGSKPAQMFGQIWNEFISSLREEDLIDNKEMDLLLGPYVSNPSIETLRWPPFLLASKAPLAAEMAAEFTGESSDLFKRIREDQYTLSAVTECYQSLKYVLQQMNISGEEKRIVDTLIRDVDEHLQKGTFLDNYQTRALPAFCEGFSDLIGLLIDPDVKRNEITLVLQNLFEVFTVDIMKTARQLESSHGASIKLPSGNEEYPASIGGASSYTMFLFNKKEYFATLDPPSFIIPQLSDKSWSEQLKRLQILLNKTESAMDVPTNIEARNRISFFTNSLLMDMPSAPHVHNMCPFSILTPYYKEETIYNKGQLEDVNEDGISILFYLQKIYPDEWNNFSQRVLLNSEETVWEEKEEDLRLWASYRGQTLARTVRGMMYYRRALQLQAFQEQAPEEDLSRGFKETKSYYEKNPQKGSYWEKLNAIIDLKFTYVATCQIYGSQKQTNDFHAADIDSLLKSYPSLRVAYIDEVEKRLSKEKTEKTFHSVLVKKKDDLLQRIYSIKLPGDPIVGEGKPENQNHAIIFTRGEALQTIDMNQDNYLEEAMKMRNLLEEFKMHHGVMSPSILGVRELIFTGSVSSLAWFMSLQESSFVTISQRVLANPLKVRFHYGHPDVFDRLFHITRGGVSKASKGINLSEDIFAGFNSTLRCGNVTHHEYIQVGKGRDVGLNQISLFEAKVANGNGEQTLSRDVYRLGHRFDFFRMMSFYFTTIGFYFNSMLVVLTIYLFLYGRLYLVLSGLENSIVRQAKKVGDNALQVALASQSVIQLGLIMALPMMMEIALERGFRPALTDLILMQLQLASVFFAFSLGTKTHYYGRTILHGGARYRATGRGFVVRHERFAENYRLYSRSHFTKGFEIVMLLIIYQVYGSSAHEKAIIYFLVTFSMWFLAGTWLFAPFLFNPSGFEWQKTVEDWDDWNKWMSSKGRIGVPASQSWESWWDEEQTHLKYTGLYGRICEIILSSRFFLYQYGLVYHLHIAQHVKSISPYGLSWVVIVLVLGVVKMISFGRRTTKSSYQVAIIRLSEVVLSGAAVGVLIALHYLAHLTLGDVLVSILTFLPTCWAILQIAQASRPLVEKYEFWDPIRSLARACEYLMGLALFTPIAVLSWFPFVSELQTRLLFNQAFSRGLQISRILAGRKKTIA